MAIRFSLRLQIALILVGVTALTVVLVGMPVLNLMERALLDQQGVESLETARLLVVLYAGLAAIVVLIVGYILLTWIIVSPLKRIGVATDRIAAGDHASRLDLTSRNEIGALAESFNNMLDRLAEGREALEKQVMALEKAKSDLERAQSAVVRGQKLASVGRLAAGVAHEVGNPLSALLGLVELMREEPNLSAEDRDDILRRLERELLRIHETIRGLLDYSRSVDDTISVANVGEVVQQAQRLVAHQPKYRDVELDVREVEKLPLVHANADRLLQVMVNLLMNAADAIDGRGRVGVDISPDEDFVRVAVTDSGPGIPDDVQDHVFEPFFTTKPPGEGTGLGLAICESIVESFDGRLEVEPGGEGRGACFSISIPVADDAAVGAPTTEGQS